MSGGGRTSSGSVLFVDTETTALHAEIGEVWEVAVVEQGGAEHRWMLPVERLEDADPMSLAIGRFHERHPQGNAYRGDVPEEEDLTGYSWGDDGDDGDDPNSALIDWAAGFAALTHGAHLAGAVVSFDEERLRRLLWRCGISPSWHYHLIDVEALAAGWLARADTFRSHGGAVESKLAVALDRYPDVWVPPWDSSDLSEALGVERRDFGEPHEALADARWARAVYLAVMT